MQPNLFGTMNHLQTAPESFWNHSIICAAAESFANHGIICALHPYLFGTTILSAHCSRFFVFFRNHDIVCESFWNEGIVSALHTNVWGAWYRLRTAAKALVNKDVVFISRPNLSGTKLSFAHGAQNRVEATWLSAREDVSVEQHCPRSHNGLSTLPLLPTLHVWYGASLQLSDSLREVADDYVHSTGGAIIATGGQH